MEYRAENTTWLKYEEAKKAGDLGAMFKIVDNGKQLYWARSNCSGMANFIKRKIPRIKVVNVHSKFNWFSIQQVRCAEASDGNKEDCCIQIVLQPNSSSRKAKVNPIQTLFTQLGLCKRGGWTQPILCSYTGVGFSGHDACFSFADGPLPSMFENSDKGAQTLLATANLCILMRLKHNRPKLSAYSCNFLNLLENVC